MQPLPHTIAIPCLAAAPLVAQADTQADIIAAFNLLSSIRSPPLAFGYTAQGTVSVNVTTRVVEDVTLQGE